MIKIIFDVILVAIFIYAMLKTVFIMTEVHDKLLDENYESIRKNDFEGFAEKENDIFEKKLDENKN